MLREIDKLCRAIPHQDLAIQFDMVREIIWSGWPAGNEQPAPFVDVEAQVVARLARIARAVPPDVEFPDFMSATAIGADGITSSPWTHGSDGRSGECDY